MARIFISYAHKDNDFAKRLSLDLSRLGHDVWWDQWNLATGDRIPEKIQEGISRDDFMVVIVSPDSVASSWVKEEWGAALNKEIGEKRVIVLPVLKADCDIPLFIKHKKIADCSSDYNEGFLHLSNAIESQRKGKGKEKINVWYLDDNRDYLDQFMERHKGHFSISLFDNVVEFLEGIQEVKYGGPEFPDILLVDLYAPLSRFEANLKLKEEADQKIQQFLQLEKELKNYVDNAWEPYGIEVVNSVRGRYSHNELPIAIYTQRGLVLLDDELIIELEKMGIEWLLKKQFSAQTERLFLSKIMMCAEKDMGGAKKKILILDDNPKFIEAFIKRHSQYYDIESITDQGEVLPTIEKMKYQQRFPNVLIVDLYYPRGNDEEAMKLIEEANEKLQEFHNFEEELKQILKKTYEPIGIEVIKGVREMYDASKLPVMIYSQSGLLLLDDTRIRKISDLDTGWLLKHRYSSRVEQIKIITQVIKAGKKCGK
jgi:CheY-like chemotaxis protein